MDMEPKNGRGWEAGEHLRRLLQVFPVMWNGPRPRPGPAIRPGVCDRYQGRAMLQLGANPRL
jgi:hypothetical protein